MLLLWMFCAGREAAIISTGSPPGQHHCSMPSPTAPDDFVSGTHTHARMLTHISTPHSPEKMKDAMGRLEFFRPTRARRMAREMAVTASSCPITRPCSTSSILISRWVSSDDTCGVGRKAGKKGGKKEGQVAYDGLLLLLKSAGGDIPSIQLRAIIVVISIVVQFSFLIACIVIECDISFAPIDNRCFDLPTSMC